MFVVLLVQNVISVGELLSSASGMGIYPHYYNYHRKFAYMDMFLKEKTSENTEEEIFMEGYKQAFNEVIDQYEKFMKDPECISKRCKIIEHPNFIFGNRGIPIVKNTGADIEYVSPETLFPIYVEYDNSVSKMFFNNDMCRYSGPFKITAEDNFEDLYWRINLLTGIEDIDESYRIYKLISELSDKSQIIQACRDSKDIIIKIGNENIAIYGSLIPNFNSMCKTISPTDTQFLYKQIKEDFFPYAHYEARILAKMHDFAYFSVPENDNEVRYLDGYKRAYNEMIEQYQAYLRDPKCVSNKCEITLDPRFVFKKDNVILFTESDKEGYYPVEYYITDEFPIYVEYNPLLVKFIDNFVTCDTSTMSLEDDFNMLYFDLIYPYSSAPNPDNVHKLYGKVDWETFKNNLDRYDYGALIRAALERLEYLALIGDETVQWYGNHIPENVHTQIKRINDCISRPTMTALPSSTPTATDFVVYSTLNIKMIISVVVAIILCVILGAVVYCCCKKCSKAKNESTTEEP